MQRSHLTARNAMRFAGAIWLTMPLSCGYDTFSNDTLPAGHTAALVPIADQDFEAVIAFAEFPHQDASNICQTTCASLSQYREGLRLNQAWHGVTTTYHWQSLQNAYDVYQKDKCPAITQSAGPMSDTCSTVADSVQRYWNQVKTSPEWQAAVHNDNLRGLLQTWRKARAGNCITAT